MRGLFLFVAILLSAPVLAQAQNDAQVIAAISEHMQVADEVSGDFVQEKTIQILPQALRSTGSFSYSQSAGLEWVTHQPIASRLVFDAKGIRQDVNGKTVWEVDGQQPLVLTITRVMTSVLSLDWAALQNYFEVSAKIESGSWQLRLIPRDATLLQIIESMSVVGDTELQEMTLHEANGDNTLIKFTINN